MQNKLVIITLFSLVTLPLAIILMSVICAASYAVLLLLVIGYFAFQAQKTISPRLTTHSADIDASAAQASLLPLPAPLLADALPDVLLLLDEKADILFINQEGHKIFPDLEIETAFLSRFRAPEIVDLVKKAYHERKTENISYLEKGAQERFFLVSLVPLSPLFYVCIFRERTESRQIEKMRADFIANASHELRTPLASLRGFIETLNGPAKNDEVARSKFLSIMQEQSERMSRLIDDLLSLSRLEMKTAPAKSEKIELHGLFVHLIDSLTPLAEMLSVKISLTCPPALYIHGNRDEIIQLFQNLVENACKYGSSGGKVDILAEENDGDVTIHVRDYGPGIAAEHIPRLTERFYRVNAEISRTHKGTGLGLAIVKHILAHHDARLAIHSNLGKGAEFSVTFHGDMSA